MMTVKKGKLKYSKNDNSWYVFLKDNPKQKFIPNDDILDIDLKLSNYHIPCALVLEEGSLGFVESSLNLDICFEYDIILYLPWRKFKHKDELDIPF